MLSLICLFHWYLNSKSLILSMTQDTRLQQLTTHPPDDSTPRQCFLKSFSSKGRGCHRAEEKFLPLLSSICKVWEEGSCLGIAIPQWHKFHATDCLSLLWLCARAQHTGHVPALTMPKSRELDILCQRQIKRTDSKSQTKLKLNYQN